MWCFWSPTNNWRPLQLPLRSDHFHDLCTCFSIRIWRVTWRIFKRAENVLKLVTEKSETHLLYPKYFLRKLPGFDTHKHDWHYLNLSGLPCWIPGHACLTRDQKKKKTFLSNCIAIRYASCFLCLVDRASLYNLFQMKPARCTLFLSIFTSTSLHVSSNYVPTIRRSYCINATLVFFTLYGWLSGLLVGMRPADQTAARTDWKIPV